MKMENEKTKNMETDIYLCLMEFDNKEVDSYSYVIDGEIRPCRHYSKLRLFAKISVNRKPFLKRTILSPAKIVSTVNKLQRCRREHLEACNFMSGNKILCSFTAILHRVFFFANMTN